MYFSEASFKVGQGIDGLGLFSHWEDQGAKVLREQFLRMVEASYSFSVVVVFVFFFTYFTWAGGIHIPIS